MIFARTLRRLLNLKAALWERVHPSRRPGGIYSYFNGLAPDNIFFHTVYCRLASAELERLGLETSFEVCPIDTADPKIWRGVKRRYWWGSQYFLPTCTLRAGPTGGEEDGEGSKQKQGGRKRKK